MNEYTRVCSTHFSFGGKPKKRLGPEDIPSEFAWTKAKPQRPTRRWRNDKQSNNDDSEAPGSVTTKEKSSLVSPDQTDLNLESLHLLADTAAMRSKTAPIDTSGLSLLSEACESRETLEPSLNVSPPMNVNKQNNQTEYVLSLEKELKNMKTNQLSSNNVKADRQKLKFYTSFIHPEVFDICFDFITDGQMTEETDYKLDCEQSLSFPHNQSNLEV